tara:strand:- start:46 stop:294 length:249 start_codon:yes stop_codon:yes gene_type:complete
MKKLYESALKVTSQIETIEFTISEMENFPSSEQLSLRTENYNNEIHLYADVRPSSYIQFLHSELKDLEKKLKRIESEIKNSL